MAPRGEETEVSKLSGALDWDWIKGLDPKTMEEDDFQKLIPLVTEFIPNEQEELNNLISLFRVTAAALKSRDEDLNEAMDALENKEADKEIKNENKKLRKEIKELKKESKEMDKQLKRLQTAKHEGGTDAALQDIWELEQTLEQSQKENREMEKDLERERRNKDDLEKQIKLLNMEKTQLKSEVDTLRDELENARKGDDVGSSSGIMDEAEEKKFREMEETVRMKNKQIQSLLEEIEQVEKEGAEYQNKLIELRDQMSETTKQMNAMTGEYVAMKESAQHYDSLMNGLQKENERVRGLLEEMLQEKKLKDKQMDEVETEVEKRIDQMKHILEFKEATIEELRSRLNRAKLEDTGMNGQDPQTMENVAMLTKALRERDEQIEQLQENLSQASKEIESSAALIESLTNAKKKGGKGVDPIQKSLINVRAQLQKSEEKIAELEESLKEAEDAAKEKSEDLSTTISQLRAYERGEYGLEQAVEEVKHLKSIEKIKSQKIEELTSTSNHYQYVFGELLEEVNQFRDKADLDPYDIEQLTAYGSLKTDFKMLNNKNENMKKLQTQKQKDRALLQVMGREIERLEEERIQLKTENRKMARQLGHKAAELGLNSEDLQAMEEYRQALKSRRQGLKDQDNFEIIEKHENVVFQQKEMEEKIREIEQLQIGVVEYKTKYEELLEENDDLRKGMKEILQDVKDQDGKSDVMIHCPALEKLVGILDARHLWGSYHPAMNLKAQIDKLEGANTELRDQIRKSRLEEDKLTNHLQRTKAKLTSAEAELSELRDAQMLQQATGTSGHTGKGNDLKLVMPSLVPPAVQSATSGTSPGAIMSSTSGEMVNKLNMQLIQVLNQLEAKEEHCQSLKDDLETQQNKLSVFRHQIGLVYEEFYQERKLKDQSIEEMKENFKRVEENLEASSAKIHEYENHFNVLQDRGEMESKFADTTRKIVILRSNEALMIRRYKALEDSEKNLRKENLHQKEEMVKIENQFTEKLGCLKRYKDMAAFKIESLQRALSECVPSSSLEESNSQYADLTARYRLLLEQEQSHSANERKIEELELVIGNLSNEKSKLTEELQSAKEKLHSSEVMVTRLHSAASATASITGDESPVVAMIHDHQLESLTKQLATLEMKELNEKQRADHAENKYKLVQAQVLQLEKRNGELEIKFADTAKANLELQKTERSLRDQLGTSIPKEKFVEANAKVQQVEGKLIDVIIENDKLREVADVARNQIEVLEHKKSMENTELEALRHEIIDLQSQSDEKSLVGKLHRQIVSFQLKENDNANKIKQLENKLSHSEAHSLRIQQRADEKEAMVVQIRTQSYIKCKSLFKIIQDLRRQYSGSVPLSRQEKLSEILRDLKEGKRQTSLKLKMAEEKLLEAQSRADELIVKQESIDNFLSSLKQGAGTKQVIEWQKKLEELRLRELRSRRQSERWSAEVDHLRELTTSQAKRIDQLEEELVRIENQVEQKQLDWETRQVELETLEDPNIHGGIAKSGAGGIRGDKSQTVDALMIPNPDWPLAKQLEQSLNMVKAQAKSIDENKSKLTEARKLIDELKKKSRESESMVLAKDKIINDLRLQVPSSVDRAMAIASVTGDRGLPVALTTDYESKQSLSIAQATVVSLRERLNQKEETLGRFEKLLKQSRSEYDTSLRQRQDEIIALKSTVRNQNQTIHDLKSQSSYKNIENPTGIIYEKVMRIEELEDDILDLQTSLQEVSKEMAVAKSEATNYKSALNAKKKELDSIKESLTMDSQLKQSQSRQEMDMFSSEVKMLKNENAILQDELTRARESLEKSPGNVIPSLVEKLRNDISDKDKKIRAMGRIIADLKEDLVTNAMAKDQKEHSQISGDVLAVASELQDAKRKIEDLNIQNDKFSKQVEYLKSKQVTSFAEIKALKEELSKKGSMLVKLKEDKLGSRSGRSSDLSPAKSSGDREKDELKKQIKQLETKLSGINKAEKPLESLVPLPEDQDQPKDSVEKQIRTAAELARWDESKKWLHKIEVLKEKLKDADAEVSKLSKSNNSLRDMVSRLEREKLMLENRAKGGRSSVKSNLAEIKMKELQVENTKLREELESVNHNLLMESSQGTETLKLKNKFLQDRIEAQERKITALELSKKAGGDAGKLIKKLEEVQEREKECQKQRFKLEEENISLKMKLEHHQIYDPQITKVVFDLKKIIDDQRESKNDALALELTAITDELSGKKSSSSTTTMSDIRTLTSPKKTKQLTEELQKLKVMNEELIGKLEAKNKELNELRSSRIEPKSLVQHQDTGITYAVPKVEEIRKMEADLKRKSDLLTEVKVLLKQAADRERAMIATKEDLTRKLKLVLDVNPKSASETLAKELRQAKLTIDRLECEKKELQHKIAEIE